MKILATEATGFIGSYVCKYLPSRGDEAVGSDNINSYYDIDLKYGHSLTLGIEENAINWYLFVESNVCEEFRFVRMNLEDKQAMQMLPANERFGKVMNPAAQAGVRYFIESPYVYVKSSIDGFLDALKGCRHYRVRHLIYASSNSVYGLDGKVPFSENDGVARPVSLCAVTKEFNGLMAHAYSYLYAIPTTGLHFFVVYGPWRCPDMSPLLFASAILNNRPIKVFDNGGTLRDFTYTDGIIEEVLRMIDRVPEPNLNWNDQNPEPSSSKALYKIYDIDNPHPVKLMDLIETIEKAIGHSANKVYFLMQSGDVYQTNADTTALERKLRFKPNESIIEGVRNTIDWYRSFYRL